MKKIQLCCADFTFPLLEHQKVFDLVALLGFDGIDIGLFSGRSHITAETEFDNISKKAKLLKQQTADRGLSIADIYLQLDTNLAKFAINHPDDSKRQYAREYFLKCIEYVNEAGATHLTTLPGMLFTDESAERSVQRSYEELNWRVEQAKAAGLHFSVEVHTGSPFIAPADSLKLVQAVKDLELTLDYTHYIRNGYAQQDVDPLLPYAGHFHARGATPNKLQSAVSKNIIDYTDIVHKMKTSGYEGWIGLEYIWIEWEGCNEVDTLSETILLRDIIKNALP